MSKGRPSKSKTGKKGRPKKNYTKPRVDSTAAADPPAVVPEEPLSVDPPSPTSSVSDSPAAANLFGIAQTQVFESRCLISDSETFLSNQEVQQHQESSILGFDGRPRRKNYRPLKDEEKDLFKVY